MRINGHPLVKALDPAPDPATTTARLLGLPQPIFLDSSTTDDPLGRYSYVTADPVILFRTKRDTTQRRDRGADQWVVSEEDALQAVGRTLSQFPHEPLPDLPPFQGGAAGYIGYEFGATLERVPVARFDDVALPDLVLGIYDWVVAWDHLRGLAWLISSGFPESGARGREVADERMAEITAIIDSGDAPVRFPAIPVRPLERAPSRPILHETAGKTIGLRSSWSKPEYYEAAQRVIDYILAGDVFQANLAQRFEAPLEEHPFDLYRRLRCSNPAPFGGYLGLGDSAIVSISPERFLSVGRDGFVETRPIKGTRPRSDDPKEDASLAQALCDSAKDCAENVMIVDLLRNDLSRVCLPGSIRVPALLQLESHPTVHHLVSTVTGTLRPDCDHMDLVRATFPGGSITGAPKIRAMEIIAELEPSRRGVYCGSIGYFSFTGVADLNIAIRTAVAAGGTLYFGAGGGIVADSGPEAEYRETLTKAKAFIDCLAQKPESAAGVP